MAHGAWSGMALLIAGLLAPAAGMAWAANDDPGNGFRHHGVATPVSNHRGTVATVDGNGNNVVLVWLYDHRGGYALLEIQAATGAAREIPVPFPPGGDCPFASILSTKNKFYTHFNSHFTEYDPVKGEFAFFSPTAPQMAMGMTEDDGGVIWSVTYPNSGVVSFNPETREFKDYGHVYAQNWAQYQRSVAADDAGWVYFGVGNTASQIIVFDPATGTATPVVPEDKRIIGTGAVQRDVNGKVYGQSGDLWYELYQGQARAIEKPAITPKPIITSSQGLFHTAFPDGKVLQTCDLTERILEVSDPATGQVARFRFDYTSEGAHIMGMAAASDGTICGGTAFPMRFFSYNPTTGEWIHRDAYGQWNAVVTQGDTFFVGAYGGGVLLEWDPGAPWVPTVKGNPECNPRYLTECTPAIHRPHDLLAHPDGKTIVLAGTPGYGYTGGGLLFWDRETRSATLVEHTALIPEHSTTSLVALPGGKLLGGTTTMAGTGGEVKATEAVLYILDLATRTIDWQGAVLPGVQNYPDMILAPNGLVYGVADSIRFFVFDPVKRQVVHEQDLRATLGSTAGQQQSRVFVAGPDQALYMLFVKGIVQVDCATHALTLIGESPVPIGPGGTYLEGRIYFGSGSHVYSFTLPE
ncbi:MAG TPA: hypothetical protein PKX85_12280 [Candidatus Hydrogenedentes bacterium]|nr:hypothetical protein [Candidatus Hydrogenedentota bacterium]